MFVDQTFLIVSLTRKFFAKQACLQLSFNGATIHRTRQSGFFVDLDTAGAFLFSECRAKATTGSTN